MRKLVSVMLIALAALPLAADATLALCSPDESLLSLVTGIAETASDYYCPASLSEVRDNRQAVHDYRLYLDEVDKYFHSTEEGRSMPSFNPGKAEKGVLKTVSIPFTDTLSLKTLSDLLDYDWIMKVVPVPLAGYTRVIVTVWRAGDESERVILDRLSFSGGWQDIQTGLSAAVLKEITGSGYGAVKVDTPYPVECFIDGERVDVSKTAVEEGTHTLECRRSGFGSVKTECEIRDGETFCFTPSFTPLKTESVMVQSEVGPARIFLNGEDKGVHSLIGFDGCTFPLSVMFEKPGFENLQRLVSRPEALLSYEMVPEGGADLEMRQRKFYFSFLQTVCAAAVSLSFSTVQDVRYSDRDTVWALQPALKGACAVSVLSLFYHAIRYGDAAFTF